MDTHSRNTWNTNLVLYRHFVFRFIVELTFEMQEEFNHLQTEPSSKSLILHLNVCKFIMFASL